jgi:hypothetical protein
MQNGGVNNKVYVDDDKPNGASKSNIIDTTENSTKNIEKYTSTLFI